MIGERLPHKIGLFFFSLAGWLCVDLAEGDAQIPTDTSYTVASTYRKLVKQYPNIRSVPPGAFTDVRQFSDVVYRTLPETPFGKRDLHADIFVPSGKKKLFPAIVMIHGGGWRSGNKSLNTPMAQHLAKKGFVVVSVEYRLSLEARYPAAVHDIKAAVRWVRKHSKDYQVDTGKIAIAGYSAGGQLASLVGLTNGNKTFEEDFHKGNVSAKVHAVVDMDGLLDFTNPESLAVKRTEASADVSWLGGSYEQMPERWKEASPIVWVNRDAPPFLFINSSQSRFHAGCADMVNRLNQLGIYNEVHKLDDAPHSYWFFQPWFDSTVEFTVSFLHKVFNSKGQ